jgi:hypothetical protein
VIIVPRKSSVADLGLEPNPPRSDTLHVSTLIKAILVGLEPERFSNDSDPSVKFEMGFAVERAIEEAWRLRRIEVLRPGEFEKDGITGSPDGVSFDSDGPIVDEIKCTWMSSRGAPEDKKFWHWLVQMKAYCYLLDTTRARLHTFFVNGDYAQHREPQYLSWDLQFTEREILENWNMLLSAAIVIRRQSSPPPAA